MSSSRLTHLGGGTTPAEHLTIFRLSYFFLVAPLSPSQNTALTALRQCLHLDPDSSLCLPAHRLLKSLDKGFVKAELLLSKGDHRGLLDFLLGRDRTGTNKDAFLKTYEDALQKHTSPSTLTVPITLPPTRSPRLTTLLRMLCASHTQLNLHRRGMSYCERLLSQNAALLGDEELDVGAAGKAEGLMAQEEWEEAVRVLESAWERARGEDVSAIFIAISGFISFLTILRCHRSNNAFKRLNDS